ncbi:MAG: hypothetical protein V3T74_11770 [Gemmatimonadales bacterium]
MTARRLIACILLPCYLVACSTWKTQEASPQQVLADEQPDKVRVTLADGSQVVLEEPVISGDTLTGVAEGQQRSIPLSDVADVQVKKTEALLTAAFVFGTVVVVGALALGVAYAIVCGGDACSN